MQEAYQFAYDVALYYAKRFLPETMWEDCACDFRLHLRAKATSDDQLLRWFEDSPAFISRSARNYVIDRVRKQCRSQKISLSWWQDSVGEPVARDFRDERSLPDEMLNRTAFWQEISSISPTLPKRSIELLRSYYLEENSHAEIAAKTGIKLNTVAKILSRALHHVSCECEKQGVTSDDLFDFLSTAQVTLYRKYLRFDDV